MKILISQGPTRQVVVVGLGPQHDARDSHPNRLLFDPLCSPGRRRERVGGDKGDQKRIGAEESGAGGGEVGWGTWGNVTKACGTGNCRIRGIRVWEPAEKTGARPWGTEGVLEGRGVEGG